MLVWRMYDAYYYPLLGFPNNNLKRLLLQPPKFKQSEGVFIPNLFLPVEKLQN